MTNDVATFVDGYSSNSIESCASCAADIPERFPHCCRGGACPPTSVDHTEASCMINTEWDVPLEEDGSQACSK